MKNGLYSVTFKTPLGVGTGVVFAQDGQMWGGDAGIYYRGSYQINGEKLTAHVDTDRHAMHGLVQSVLGNDRAQIILEGKTVGDNVEVLGRSPQAPGITFQAHLRRLSN